MALLTTQNVSRTGLNPTYAACGAGGDEFVPGTHTFIHVQNGGGSSQTVTVVTPKDVRGQAIADVAVAVPNGDDRMIGPFPANDYANPADGKADITYTGVTSLTIAVIDV